MLIRLENGDHVDPAKVIAVKAVTTQKPVGGYHQMIPPSSRTSHDMIVCLGGAQSGVEYPTLAEAEQARDRIAAQINEAREARR